ncbi:Alpha/beta hydrolase fold-1 [Xylaria arbuscula]|nr:Alpha/beta hydrolase fold-1 [Xylaria arbuscula]
MAASIIAEPGSSPIVFFTPGAWHRPWVFDDVRRILSTRGFKTESSSLATPGSTGPNVGLPADTAQIRSALKNLVNDGKEVVVVAHSYGGLVTSNAVEGLGIEQRTRDGFKGSVIMILYLAAFALPANDRLSGALDDSHPDWWDVSKDGFITPMRPIDIFYADVETSLASKAVDALEPMPVQTGRDVSAYDPVNAGFEVGYIFTAEDQAIPLEAQKAMFARFPTGSFSATLVSSHSPFLSMPDTLADTIQNAIEFMLAKRLSN